MRPSHHVDATGAAQPVPVVALDPLCLAAWPLPYDEAADKHDRGTVFVIGGSPRTVGAVVLSGVAALRAGAGRLQLALTAAAAPAVSVAVPEALVAELPVREDGRVRPRRAIERLAPLVATADAVLVGPGLLSDNATGRFLQDVVRHIGPTTVVVLDAAAATNLGSLADVLGPAAGRLVITANPREVARVLGRPRSGSSAAASTRDLRDLAVRHDAVVVSSGEVVAHDGRRWSCAASCAGLGTSGSGDVLAGITAGLAARCGRADQAACWAAYTHVAVGQRLSDTVHRLGFLAREIADGVPGVLRDLEPPPVERRT